MQSEDICGISIMKKTTSSEIKENVVRKHRIIILTKKAQKETL